jgi:ABC-type bacteriocin/lantibiotic exporter with double-glycine peptidase domain
MLNEQLYELHFENGKLHEKMNNMTNESFENIRTIKFYGWTEYFREKILEYTVQQKALEDEIVRRNKVSDLVWELVSAFVNPLAFCTFLGMGGTLTLPQTMEIIMLMDNVKGPLHHLQTMSDQFLDIQMVVMRISDFLNQPEVP